MGKSTISDKEQIEKDIENLLEEKAELQVKIIGLWADHRNGLSDLEELGRNHIALSKKQNPRSPNADLQKEIDASKSKVEDAQNEHDEQRAEINKLTQQLNEFSYKHTDLYKQLTDLDS